MSGQSSSGGKKGNKKHGRQRKKPASMRYTNERRWIKNKAAKVRRYMRKFPNWKPDSVSGEVRTLL